MKDQLIGLARLHQLDKSVFALRDRRDEIQGRIDEIADALEALQQDLDRQKEALGETAALRREQESELKLKEDLIGRAKSKMAAVKTTKEFMAAEREVESARKDHVMVDEQVKQLMETEVRGLDEIDQRQERLNTLRAEMTEKSEGLTADVAKLDEELSASTTGREDLVKAVDRQLVTRYDFIAGRLSGAAMSACDGGTCEACNMQVRPQVYNLLHRGESLHMCAHCKRILYLDAWISPQGGEVSPEAAPQA